MRVNELRFRELIEYISVFWGNTEAKLTKWERGRTLPMIPTVYLLVDDKDTIVYVGQTSCLRRRIAQHVSSPRKEKLSWASVYCFSPQVMSQHRRLQIETVLAALAIPKGNRLIALRRTRYDNWREVRWSVSRWKDAKRTD